MHYTHLNCKYGQNSLDPDPKAPADRPSSKEQHLGEYDVFLILKEYTASG
jgi:hypothetical protein